MRPFAHARSQVFLVSLVLTGALAATALAATAEKPAGLEERRLELERRELELEKEQLRIDERRREIQADRKKLAEENAAREVITIQLQGEVLFDFGKAEIRARSEPTLEKVGAVIQQFPNGLVTIVGHTDSVGTAQANLSLSRARAQAVRDWLVTKGRVEAPAITVEGYGETLPIVPNETPDGADDPLGRQKNRRVEIRIAEVERRSAEVEAAMQELGAEETDESLTIDLSGDVLFAFGKAAILPDAEKTLGKVAIVLGQFPDGAVRIDGYTDSMGPEDANRVLSQQRADAVKAWLAERSRIPASRVEAKGLGEADPVAPNTKPDGTDNPEGRQKNRRVEIVLKK